MNAAKAYRKLKEVEETKLANRLMLLRLELQKSHRKIQETEKRTHTIVAHQAEIESRNREKLEELQKKQDEQQMAQQINQIARTRMQIIRRTKVKSVTEQKREEAQSVITARRTHYATIEQQKEDSIKRALAVKNFVKTTLEVGKESRRITELQKREAARQAFAERVKEEASKSKKAEEKVNIMEAEELRLIKLLEDTQSYQRSAYHELESALVSSRVSIHKAAESKKQALNTSLLTSRSHQTRMQQQDVDEIALATLPPVLRKKLGSTTARGGSGSGSHTPSKSGKPVASTRSSSSSSSSPQPASAASATKPGSKKPSPSASQATMKVEESKEEIGEKEEKEEEDTPADPAAAPSMTPDTASTADATPSTAPSVEGR